jgi:4-amino-4-deoxy-L-arabinose transferase-like glycosyltransferase
MSSVVRAQVVLILAAGVVFFTNLGVPKLWDEDEPRNAACAREMAARGDWVVPTFNEELRTQKPVLLYWLMIGSYSLFGVGELAARLPSALLAVGTTLLTFHTARRLMNGRAGFLAGVMIATSLMFGVAGRAATPDSCLVFFTSLSIFGYVWSVSRHGNGSDGDRADGFPCAADADFVPRRWIDFAFIYAAMALAVLAKGPIGAALPVSTIGLFLLIISGRRIAVSGPWTRRLLRFARRFVTTTWAMRPLTLLVFIAIVAGPWYVLVGIRTDWRWTAAFFGTENLSRFQTSMEGHGGPFFYYIGAILVGFFPWSIVLPAGVWFSVRDAFARACCRPAHLLLVCWAGLWIGVFSMAGTKLPSYVLPAYPALAMMAASFVDRWLDNPTCVRRWLMQAAWGALAVVGLAITIALPLVARRVFPGEETIGLVGLIPLTGGVLAILLHYRKKLSAAVSVVGVTSVLFSLTMFGVVAVCVSRHQNSASLVKIAAGHKSGDYRLATFAHAESSVVYYAKRRVERLDDPADVAQFFEKSPESYLITNGDRWAELKPHLPPDVAIVAREPRFLKGGEVYLLGRRQSTAAVPTELRR